MHYLYFAPVCVVHMDEGLQKYFTERKGEYYLSSHSLKVGRVGYLRMCGKVSRGGQVKLGEAQVSRNVLSQITGSKA